MRKLMTVIGTVIFATLGGVALANHDHAAGMGAAGVALILISLILGIVNEHIAKRRG